MKNLYIVDAYNLIYRMFYAIPEMHTRSGEPVNAIYGVTKFLKQLSDISSGDDILVASESGSNFREALYPEYKGTRDRMPDALRSQIEGVFACFEAFGIPVLVREGYEADDIIGTLAHRHCDGGCEVVIVSSDKDLYQFVDDGRVRIFDAMKQKNLRRADVIEKFGVPPEQVRDYLSIVGDSSDNIPGINGFGPKKAEDLLKKYSTLEGIYKELGIIHYGLGVELEIDREKYDACDLSEKIKQALVDQRNNAFLSQKLATIETNLDIDCIGKVLSRDMFLDSRVIEFLKKYEFRSLLPKDYLEEKKSLQSTKVYEVANIDTLQEIFHIARKSGKIYLATTKDSLSLGIEGSIYTADLQRIDIEDFSEKLLTSDIEVIGYDLKEDMKYLLHLKKSLQSTVEGQGRLF